MKRLKYILMINVMGALGGMSCKEVYTPPAIKNNPFLLVVDGIVASGNDPTIITVSRARNVAEAVPSQVELDAKVSVGGATGVEYPFTEQGNGRYYVDKLALGPPRQSQLKMRTK